MLKQWNRQSVQAFAVITASLTIMGCTSIQKLFEGEELPAGAFRSTAAVRTQTMPLPVEIAENILSITQNGDGPTEPEQVATAVQQNSAAKGLRKIAQMQKRRMKGSSKSALYHPFSGRRKLANSNRSSGNGKDQTYNVKPGDTLMKIAYAKYGDIFRWRDIYNQNRDLLKDYNKIQVGSVLVLNGVEFIVIEKNGEPYLIRKGDTLRGISNKLYGSGEHWRSLWKNNQQLIKNPNRIFAGFTLYYRPAGEVVTGPEARVPSSGNK